MSDYEDRDDEPEQEPRRLPITTVEDALRAIDQMCSDHGYMGLKIPLREQFGELFLSEITRARGESYDRYQRELHSIFDHIGKAKTHLETWKAWRHVTDHAADITIRFSNVRPTEWILVDKAQQALAEATKIDDRIPF